LLSAASLIARQGNQYSENNLICSPNQFPEKRPVSGAPTSDSAQRNLPVATRRFGDRRSNAEIYSGNRATAPAYRFAVQRMLCRRSF
jgi:hypothetical protein